MLKLPLFGLSVTLLLTASAVRGAVITKWDFGAIGVQSAPYNSPAPSTGSGTALSLGMTNTYTYAGTTATNSVTSDDVLSTVGSITENTWRIRGTYLATGTAPNIGSPSNKGNVNGWNSAAPQYSQGVEFDVNTTGYTGITASFDWFSTTNGVRDLQEQYTLDGSTWTNINPVVVAAANDFVFVTIDLTGISGADNNALFGIRLVSAYDPTYSGAGAPTYTQSALVSGLPVTIDNKSGNWRFGNIAVNGTSVAVPEPASISLMALGGIALLARRRR